MREESASPSASRTVGTTRISSSRFRSRTTCFTTATCCASLRPKYARSGRDDREQLHADRRDAAEVAGAVLALEPLGGAGRLDPRREAGRVELVGGRREEEVDAGLGRDALVAGEVARVRRGRAGLELRRVDEEARDDDVALRARGVEQRDVPRVQRAHRRHEPDRARPATASSAARSSRIVRNVCIVSAPVP